MDERYRLIKQRFETFSIKRLQYLKENIDSVCLDTFNYDEQNKTYCPIAILMGIDQSFIWPTNEKVRSAIEQLFYPANILKGVVGRFYKGNRKNDLLYLCDEIIQEKYWEAMGEFIEQNPIGTIFLKEKIMPQQITKWKTTDDKEFETEVEALRHENKILAKQANSIIYWEEKASRDNPASSYGSSGGGGHD